MFISLINFEVEGVNLDRLLRSLNINKIDIYNTRKLKDKLYFAVKWHNRQKVVDLLTKQCYNYLITNTSGVNNYINFVKKNFVIFSLIFILVAACVVLNGFLWQVDVYCDKDIDLTQEANAILQSYNVQIGTPVNRISLDILESKLVYELEKVVYAIVKLSGGRLTVMLYIHEDIPQTNYNVVDDIISACDAVIERIVVISGTPQVKAGDKVVAGQILIKGERTYKDNSTSPVRAAGIVYARAHSYGKVKFEKSITEYVETGNSITFNNLIIFNKEITSNKTIEFTSYNSIYKEIQIGIIPIKIVNITLTETQAVTKNVTLEQQLTILQSKALEIAVKNCTFTYTTTNYFTETIDSQIYVVADISASVEIGIYSKS